jgi:hypothetical protein
VRRTLRSAGGIGVEEAGEQQLIAAEEGL